jgi:hypothetical protein
VLRRIDDWSMKILLIAKGNLASMTMPLTNLVFDAVRALVARGHSFLGHEGLSDAAWDGVEYIRLRINPCDWGEIISLMLYAAMSVSTVMANRILWLQPIIWQPGNSGSSPPRSCYAS